MFSLFSPLFSPLFYIHFVVLKYWQDTQWDTHHWSNTRSTFTIPIRTRGSSAVSVWEDDFMLMLIMAIGDYGADWLLMKDYYVHWLHIHNKMLCCDDYGHWWLLTIDEDVVTIIYRHWQRWWQWPAFLASRRALILKRGYRATLNDVSAHLKIFMNSILMF